VSSGEAEQGLCALILALINRAEMSWNITSTSTRT
jgi:hypothetical protein